MNKALIIVDMQRGFMPESEGLRLHKDGFGELGVLDGEQTIEPVNKLLAAAALHHLHIATTQDWHPRETAHFADSGTEPNFTTTWPVHCVDGTPGAELHPDVQVPSSSRRFTKGSEHLMRGEDDTSYSGYYAEDPTTGHSLPDWLRSGKVTEVTLGGLALDYCVGKTAIDLREKMGLDVTLALDATRPVAPETGEEMVQQLEALGVHITTADEWIQKLNEVAA